MQAGFGRVVEAVQHPDAREPMGAGMHATAELYDERSMEPWTTYVTNAAELIDLEVVSVWRRHVAARRHGAPTSMPRLHSEICTVPNERLRLRPF